MGRAARLRGRPRRAADRRRPDLRRARLAPTSAPTPAVPRRRRRRLPPDAFTDKGQLWGNPLYDWPALRARRLPLVDRALRARTFELFDLARIDHFRGFVAYWAVPRGAPRRARRALEARPRPRASSTPPARALGELPLIAEDLGVITPAVERLRDALGYPGMAVLQFGFDGDPHSPHLPREPRRATASSTPAPTTTTRSAAGGTALARRAAHGSSAAIDAHGVAEDEPQWALIRLAFASPARLAMVQAQDVLGLGSRGARMNMPGTAKGAWKWRLREGALTRRSGRRLREATRRRAVLASRRGDRRRADRGAGRGPLHDAALAPRGERPAGVRAVACSATSRVGAGA